MGKLNDAVKTNWTQGLKWFLNEPLTTADLDHKLVNIIFTFVTITIITNSGREAPPTLGLDSRSLQWIIKNS